MLFTNLTDDILIIEDLGFTLEPRETTSIYIPLQEVLASSSVSELIKEEKLRIELDENYQNDFLTAVSIPNMTAFRVNSKTLKGSYYQSISFEQIKTTTNIFDLTPDGKIKIAKGDYLVFVSGNAYMNSTNSTDFRIIDENGNVLKKASYTFYKKKTTYFSFNFKLTEETHFDNQEFILLSLEGKTPSSKITSIISELNIIVIGLEGFPDFITIKEDNEVSEFNLKLYDNGNLFQENVSGIDFRENLRLSQGGSGIVRVSFEPLTRNIDYAEATYVKNYNGFSFNLIFDKITKSSNKDLFSIDEDKLIFNENGTYEVNLNLSFSPVTYKRYYFLYDVTLSIRLNGHPIQVILSNMIQVSRTFIFDNIKRGDFISIGVRTRFSAVNLTDNRLLVKRLGG